MHYSLVTEHIRDNAIAELMKAPLDGSMEVIVQECKKDRSQAPTRDDGQQQ